MKNTVLLNQEELNSVSGGLVGGIAGAVGGGVGGIIGYGIGRVTGVLLALPIALLFGCIPPSPYDNKYVSSSISRGEENSKRLLELGGNTGGAIGAVVGFAAGEIFVFIIRRLV